MFVQAASPACTELETVMLDWLGKMLQLPECFLAGTHGHGGGVIQVRVLCVFPVLPVLVKYCIFFGSCSVIMTKLWSNQTLGLIFTLH